MSWAAGSGPWAAGKAVWQDGAVPCGWECWLYPDLSVVLGPRLPVCEVDWRRPPRRALGERESGGWYPSGILLYSVLLLEFQDMWSWVMLQKAEERGDGLRSSLGMSGEGPPLQSRTQAGKLQNQKEQRAAERDGVKCKRRLGEVRGKEKGSWAPGW